MAKEWTELSDLPLSNRTKNALTAIGITTAAAIPADLKELRRIPNLGTGSIAEIQSWQRSQENWKEFYQAPPPAPRKVPDPWTEDAVNKLVAGYRSGVPVKEIALSMNRREQDVYAKAARLKLHHANRSVGRKLTSEEIDILRNGWAEGKSLNDLAKILQRTETAVKTHLKKLHIRRPEGFITPRGNYRSKVKSSNEGIPTGRIFAVYWQVAQCGKCGKRQTFEHSRQIDAAADAKASGWKETVAHGWVCPDCLI
jgi:hypothetical protein